MTYFCFHTNIKICRKVLIIKNGNKVSCAKHVLQCMNTKIILTISQKETALIELVKDKSKQKTFLYYVVWRDKQAISARERALCQLTMRFEFQGISDRRKGHKSCALQMVTR